MKNRLVMCCVALAVAMWAAQRLAASEADAGTTMIYVSDMHCAACAKRIANKLYTVSGVVKVQTSVKKHFALITPQSGKTLSPKALWEAIEAAEFTPTKLVGPSGTFTKKPDK